MCYILGYQLELEEVNEDVTDPLGLQHGPFILGMVCSVATFTINPKVKPNQAHKHEAIGNMNLFPIHLVV